MRKSTKQRTIGGVVLAAMAFVAVDVSAQEEGLVGGDIVVDVQAHDTRAQELFQAGDFEGAIREFQAAQGLLPSPVRLYNMAACHERLGQRREAADLFIRFLQADDIPDERRRRAVQRLAQLTEEIAAEEQNDQVTEVHVPSDIEGETDERPRGRLSPVAFYATLGVALASSVVMAAVGGVALAKDRDFQEMNQNTAGVLELRDEGQRLTTVSNVFLGLTLTASVAAVVLAVFTGWRDPDRDARRLRIGAAPTSQGISLSMDVGF